MKNKSKRKPGFYWVKHEWGSWEGLDNAPEDYEGWEPAYWDGEQWGCFTADSLLDTDFEEISEVRFGGVPKKSKTK